MDGKVVVDAADHAEIECADVVHRVAHGITGYQGEPVVVAVRPEKIHLSVEPPADDRNRVRGLVRALSYFGGYTLYHLELPSGAALKVNLENDTRQRDGAPVQGDLVWAHWLPTSQVVLKS
jgi:putrescine transport system ATP-binding protein